MPWDWSGFVAALIPSLFTLIGVIIANRKQTALVTYRLEQLEKKQDKHNQVIERTYKLEQKVDDLEKRVK